jgi:hypothetical protein
MASLQSRLSSLITAIGTDIKALQARTPTILAAGLTSLSDTKQATSALEWRDTTTDLLQGKFAAINPVVSQVIVDRTELWLRVKHRSGASSADRKILDSDAVSDFIYLSYGTYAARPAAAAANKGWAYYATDTTALYINLTGAAWKQIAGPQEANTIFTPSTGFGTHYVSYTAARGLSYWKDPDGYVHVVGEINDDGTGLASVAANALIWDGFPVGYRPIARLYLKVGGNPGVQSLLINTSGQIRVDDNSANTTRYMNFGHLTFPTF